LDEPIGSFVLAGDALPGSWLFQHNLRFAAFPRPYTTLGLNSHFRGGAEADVWKSISVGAAAYDIQPFGNQTVFSRVTGTPGGNGAGATHGRNFQSSQQTTGTADIARDNGFSTWVDASLTPYLDA